MRFDDPGSLLELVEYHREIARRMDDDVRAKEFSEMQEKLASIQSRTGINSPTFRRAAQEFQRLRVRHLKYVMRLANRGVLRWHYWLRWVCLIGAIAVAMFYPRDTGFLVPTLLSFGLLIAAAVFQLIDLRRSMPRLTEYINALFPKP